MPDGDELLRLALSQPRQAFARATRVLAERPGDHDASVAHQTRAIVLRDDGRLDEAMVELRAALRRARASGDDARAYDVQATLGVALVIAGRTAAGLAALDAAANGSTGVLAGRVLVRRGSLLARLGRRAQALDDLNRAITLLHRAGDQVWEARARNHRFGVYAIVGQAARADRDLVIAERLFAQTGQLLESAMAVQNRADVAGQAGDLPAALAFLDEAAARYAALGVVNPDLAFDRCKVLLAAGLAAEALAEADAAVAVQRAGRSVKKAELLFAAARAAQAAGRPEQAVARAGAARDLFRAQGRAWWQARASFVLLQARYAAGDHDGRLRSAAGRLADRLDELGVEEAPTAHLLAGRLAASAGRLADADRHLDLAARFRHRGPSYGRAAGWLAQALRCEARGAGPAALRACRRGLAAAADHQQRLGAVELRAHASAYGTELAAIGQRDALRRCDPRMLLLWSERWRAGALAPAAVRPPDDKELAADLVALRAVVRGLDAAGAAGTPTARLDQERRRLEAAIRARSRRTAGTSGPEGPELSRAGLAGMLAEFGDRVLVELVALDGELFAVTAVGRRVRTHLVGPLSAALREVELARFMLRRLAHGRARPGAAADLVVAGRRLESVLLGPAVSDLDGDAPVVVVPPGRLHAVPWSMLPTLARRPVRVAPSVATWLRARRDTGPRGRRTVLVVGPGLSGTVAEVARIAERYARPVVLTGSAATARDTLAALDGAWTAHVAAHGVFRPDNPLFSALRLDDGPLTVYDLGRLRRAPYRLILSSCESGVAAPVGGDELLGTISALVPAGTASLLASVVPVNDAAAAPLMAAFHDGLRAGAGFADALLAARGGGSGDVVATATALSFVALGR
ncbi:MAG TPA: CHAT domain-containing protein [Asanoa sp.]|nr:CHAT domain-containing protein [Asanoa sp.]